MSMACPVPPMSGNELERWMLVQFLMHGITLPRSTKKYFESLPTDEKHDLMLLARKLKDDRIAFNSPR